MFSCCWCNSCSKDAHKQTDEGTSAQFGESLHSFLVVRCGGAFLFCGFFQFLGKTQICILWFAVNVVNFGHIAQDVFAENCLRCSLNDRQGCSPHPTQRVVGPWRELSGSQTSRGCAGRSPRNQLTRCLEMTGDVWHTQTCSWQLLKVIRAMVIIAAFFPSKSAPQVFSIVCVPQVPAMAFFRMFSTSPMQTLPTPKEGITTFYFVPREKFLSMGELLTWNTLKAALVQEDWSWQDVLVPSEDVLARYAVISHRWVTQNNADPSGTQYKVIKKYLEDHPSVELVWADVCCLPQGVRSNAEDAYFRRTLKSVNILYIGFFGMLLARRQRGFSILVRSRIFFGNAPHRRLQYLCVDKANARGLRVWRRRKGRRLEDLHG